MKDQRLGDLLLINVYEHRAEMTVPDMMIKYKISIQTPYNKSRHEVLQSIRSSQCKVNA